MLSCNSTTRSDQLILFFWGTESDTNPPHAYGVMAPWCRCRLDFIIRELMLRPFDQKFDYRIDLKCDSINRLGIWKIHHLCFNARISILNLQNMMLPSLIHACNIVIWTPKSEFEFVNLHWSNPNWYEILALSLSVFSTKSNHYQD